MHVSAINRISLMTKKQKCIKGLKFGNKNNIINRSISTGVIDDGRTEDLDNENLGLSNTNYDADIEDFNNRHINEVNPNNVYIFADGVRLETHEEEDVAIEEDAVAEEDET